MADAFGRLRGNFPDRTGGLEKVIAADRILSGSFSLHCALTEDQDMLVHVPQDWIRGGRPGTPGGACSGGTPLHPYDFPPHQEGKVQHDLCHIILGRPVRAASDTRHIDSGPATWDKDATYFAAH